MTKFLSTTILSIFLTVPFQSFAQNKVCGSYKGYIQDDMHQNPEFYQSISEKNQSLKKELLSVQLDLPKKKKVLLKTFQKNSNIESWKYEFRHKFVNVFN